MNRTCEVCFRHCQLKDGQIGFCGGRYNDGEGISALTYGKITSLAVDPIEKKPLKNFYPGSYILSVGSFGCNLRCPFCQNYEISWSKSAFEYAQKAQSFTPEELLKIAKRYENEGNIGIAFTYNEPLIGYEFVRDCAKLFHESGMKCVLVSNGTAELSVLSKIIPYIDAMNIDLKGFTDHYYEKVLGGNRRQVMDFIAEAVKHCHVELTTLIVPEENDSKEEMREKYIDLINDDGFEELEKNKITIEEINKRYKELIKPINSYCRKNFINYTSITDKIIRYSQPYGSESNGNQLFIQKKLDDENKIKEEKEKRNNYLFSDNYDIYNNQNGLSVNLNEINKFNQFNQLKNMSIIAEKKNFKQMNANMPTILDLPNIGGSQLSLGKHNSNISLNSDIKSSHHNF